MSVSIILLDTDQTPDGDNNLAQFQKVHSVTYGGKGLVEPLTSQGQEAEGEQTGNQVESQSPILSGLHPPKFPQPPQIMPRACEGHFIFSSRGCAYVESAQRVIQGVPHRHGGSGELRMVHQSNMVLLAEPQACANVLGQSGKGEACRRDREGSLERATEATPTGEDSKSIHRAVKGLEGRRRTPYLLPRWLWILYGK